MSSQVYGPDGLIESWDDTTRTYTDHRTGESRPYTPEENANADAQQHQQVISENESSLRAGLEKALEDALARQAQYQTVIDATNSSINSSPASYIKTIARQGKRSERALIRLIRIVGELNESGDTGTD